MQYWFANSTEEFTPSAMLEQSKAGEMRMSDAQLAKAGFLIGSDPAEGDAA